MKTYTFTMQFLGGFSGKPRATAVATKVRATKTQFIVDPRHVTVTTTAGVRFGGIRRYRRDTLDTIPKRNPFSGIGYWAIDRDSIREEEA